MITKHTTKLLHILKESKNSVVWKMMGSWQYLKCQPYPQMINSTALSNLESYATVVKNQDILLESVVKGWKRNRGKEMILRFKTRNLRHLNHMHPVLIASEQIILYKNVGAVPMLLIDPNDSNRITRRTIEMTGKNKETWPIQDFHQFWETRYSRKVTTLMGRLHISETICYIWPTHHSIPISSNLEHRNSISSLAAKMGKAYTRRYNNMHMIHKTLPTYDNDFTDNFDTKFKHFPEVVAYDTNFVDTQYGLAPFGMKICMIRTNWSTKILTTNLMTKLKVMIAFPMHMYQLHLKCIDRFRGSQSTFTWYISTTKLSVQTTKPTKANSSPWRPNFTTAPGNTRRSHTVSPAINKLAIKNQRKMLYFPMDFGELKIDRLIDTGALSSTIPEADLCKIRLMARKEIFNERPPPEFQWVPSYGFQWTVRSTYSESKIAIRSRWHYDQRKIRSHDKPYKPFDGSVTPTKQQYHTWYASGNLEHSLLFNAIE